MKKQPIRFPDELGQPMPPIYYPLLGGEGREEAQRKRAQIMVERMELLARYFGVQSDNPLKWYIVASRLAAMLVPGLTVKDPEDKSGAEKVWGTSRLAALAFEMDREKASGLNTKKAADRLAKRSPWNKIVKGADRAEALRAQYTRTHNRAEIKAARKIFELSSKPYLENSDPDAWEKSLEVLAQPDLHFYV